MVQLSEAEFFGYADHENARIEILNWLSGEGFGEAFIDSLPPASQQTIQWSGRLCRRRVMMFEAGGVTTASNTRCTVYDGIT